MQFQVKKVALKIGPYFVANFLLFWTQMSWTQMFFLDHLETNLGEF